MRRATVAASWHRQTSAPLVRAATSVLTGNLAGRATAMVASVAGAAILGPREFGAFAVLTVSSTLVASAGVLGFPALIAREMVKVDESEANAVGMGWAWRAFQTLALAALCAAAIAYLVHRSGGPLQSPAMAFIVALWAIGFGINSVLQSVLTGARLFKTLGLLSVLRAALVGAGSLVGASTIGTGAAAAVGTAGGELVAGAIIWHVYKRAKITGSAETIKPRWSVALRLAGTSGAAGFAIQGSVWAGQVLLASSYHGLEDSGGFSLSYRVVLMLTLGANVLATVSVPLIADRNLSRNSARIVQRKALMLGVSATCVPASLTAMCASPLLRLIGPAYVEYASTLRIMCLVAIVIAVNNLLSSAAVALGVLRPWILSDLLLAGALMSTSFPLIRILGAEGLAAAYLIAYALSCIYLLVSISAVRAAKDIVQ